MLHDSGAGRTTSIGESLGLPAYNPFTGQGHNPAISSLPLSALAPLHLRDGSGRVRAEHPPTLPEMVEFIRDEGIDIVLQLDFKTVDAVEPAYWALKNLTNAKGVAANEWSIYKLQAEWYKTVDEFEGLSWVRDAREEGVRLAYLPVYEPKGEGEEGWDMLAGWRGFEGREYTVGVETEMRSEGWGLGGVWEWLEGGGREGRVGVGSLQVVHVLGDLGANVDSFPGGDFIAPISSERTFWDTANFSLPADATTVSFSSRRIQYHSSSTG
ncbi:hypothetical protein KVT40_008805 [Elsinoe batatas]|uniref:Uncharacterized protein n=1 Tax=Elsinoe batatas TaxID=2601811 RepID=A0A8K0KW38_9PEZI|nr:hypothetical protein KVT40_008805 [Elsinoe batatas]